MISYDVVMLAQALVQASSPPAESYGLERFFQLATSPRGAALSLMIGAVGFGLTAYQVLIQIVIPARRRKAEAGSVRATAHWAYSAMLLEKALFPLEFHKPLVAKIIAELAGSRIPDETLFRVTRLFIEQRILMKARGEVAIPAGAASVDQNFRDLKPSMEAAIKYSENDPPAFGFKTCFKLNALDDDEPKVSEYFRTLAEIDKVYAPNPTVGGIEHSNRFITPIKVKRGFVAPMFLVTGLLSEFEEEWPKALEYFVEANRPEARCGNSEQLTMLQRFEFYCWLLWGPSIPVCQCTRWSGDFIAMQYGYGDENNSLPLVAKRKSMEQLVSGDAWGPAIGVRDGDAREVPLAFPKDIEGALVWGPSLYKTTDYFPNVYTVSTTEDKKQDFRLKYSRPGPRRSVLKGLLIRADDSKIDWESPRTSAESPYYSAYLWVMFELCDATGAPLYDDPHDRWRVLFPVFEHTNIADGYTLKFLKQRLAEKACRTVEALEEHNPGRRFRYLCAFDDPGTVQNADGSHTFYFRARRDDEKMRNDLFGDGPHPGAQPVWPNDENRIRAMIYHTLHDQESQNRMFAPPRDYKNIITACDLPDIIEQFYCDFPEEAQQTVEV